MDAPATGSQVAVGCGPYGTRRLTVVQAAAGERGVAVHAETRDLGGLQVVYTLTPGRGGRAADRRARPNASLPPRTAAPPPLTTPDT